MKDAKTVPGNPFYRPLFCGAILILLIGATQFACGGETESETPNSAAETSQSAGELREITVSQKDKQFAPTELKIKVGDSVSFRNDDPFFHNVFSFSETRVFDLGSYPQGESRKVVFDKPGEVEVECAIHETMRLKIVVE